jgi:hypothetical protein
MTRAIALGAARASCAACHGWGRVGDDERLCNCVLRQIFRSCFARWRMEQLRMIHSATTGYRILAVPGPRGPCRRVVPGNTAAEYSADFEICARQVLRAADQRLFRMHFLRGRPWFDCVGPLGLDRGNFFHAVYRIEGRMGRALLDRQMYPTQRYFGITTSDERRLVVSRGPHANSVELRRRDAWLRLAA